MFIRRVTHQLLGPAKPYNVVVPLMQYQEQKMDSAGSSSVGALSQQESKELESPRLDNIGNYEDIAEQKKIIQNDDVSQYKFADIADGEWFIYAPVIGKMKVFLGNPYLMHPDIITKLHATIGDVVRSVANELIKNINNNKEIDYDKIQKRIEDYPAVRRDLITYMCCMMYERNHRYNAELEITLKPVLNELVKRGALYEIIALGEPTNTDYDYLKFETLVSYWLDNDALNLAIARTSLGCHSPPSDPRIDESFADFAEIARLCIPRGANINAVQYCNESFGSFLQMYLAYEGGNPTKLIAFLESLRQENLKGSQFNYELCDGYGRNPLLLAINTCQEDAALALLRLQHPVGINQKDSQGRTPLLIAAALGLKNVVEQLLLKGANPLETDNRGEGYGLEYYSQLSEKEVYDLLSPVLHPYRCTGISDRLDIRSYLYWNDENHSPVCLYEKGEKEKTGKDQIPHLVVLSNHKDYIGRVHQAIQCAKDEGNVALAAYFQKQLNNIKDVKPVIEICCEKQNEVRDYLKTKEAKALVEKSAQSFKSTAETSQMQTSYRP